MTGLGQILKKKKILCHAQNAHEMNDELTVW